MRQPPAQRILHINEADAGGGAQVIARTMMQAARAADRESWLLVNRKLTEDPAVLPIPRSGGGPAAWRSTCQALAGLGDRLPGRPGRAFGRAARLAEQPFDALDWLWGREPFHRPLTRRLTEIAPGRPDLIHAHNLHHAYFDLRALPELSKRAPLVMTLHDEWLLTGHCAGTIGCDKWRHGCGGCPDLGRYPPLRRDRTAANWRRKAEIYKRSRLFVSTPSQWLMSRVEESMLAQGIAERRVIHNGIDTATFRTGDRQAARQRFDLPADAYVLLFAANGMKSNIYKDYPTIREALRQLTRTVPDRQVVLLALGDEAGDPEADGVDIRFLGLTNRQDVVRDAYKAADLYLHAARSDNFPTTILEALAAGRPVVATAVGGIPEQIRSLALPGSDTTQSTVPLEQATGTLVEKGDATAMAAASRALLTDPSLRSRLAANAARDAQDRFDIAVQTRAYLDWYDELVERIPCEQQ